MRGRKILAFLAWSLAVLSGAGGLGLIGWAINREYADNQRNWGFIGGTLGIIVAIGLIGIASAISRANQRR